MTMISPTVRLGPPIRTVTSKSRATFQGFHARDAVKFHEKYGPGDIVKLVIQVESLPQPQHAVKTGMGHLRGQF